jgi:site-specific recombinase XerD
MRMIEDTTLSGLAAGTQATYIDAVRKLAGHYRRSPDQLTEEEVRAYILRLRHGGAARGTFKANHYGIQYFYRQTLDCDWALFSKKDPPAETEALPHAISDAEARKLLALTTNPIHKTCFALMSAALEASRKPSLDLLQIGPETTRSDGALSTARFRPSPKRPVFDR